MLEKRLENDDLHGCPSTLILNSDGTKINNINTFMTLTIIVLIRPHIIIDVVIQIATIVAVI